MSSPSFMDYFAEKIYSYSTKMRGDSFLHYNTSFLMHGNPALQHDRQKIINDPREYGIIENSHHRTMFINDLLEELGSYQSLRYLHNLGKPEVNAYVNNTIFSSHILNLMNALNSFCFKSSSLFDFEIPFMPCSSSVGGNMNHIFNGPTPFNFETDSSMIKTCDVPAVSDSKTSASETTSDFIPAFHPIAATDKKCNMASSVQLNLKLTSRKTKQMNRRSRNRRRRQKKVMHASTTSSLSSSSDDDSDDNNSDYNGNLKQPVSESVSIVTESSEFGCTVSFQHTVQIPSLASSFVVPVESDSDDDSDWESYSETDNLNDKKCQVLPSESVPSESDSSEYSDSDEEGKSSGFSFVISVGSSSEEDDDDDWDTCDASEFTDVTEFEFTGLFVTNLCSFRPVQATDCKSDTVESLQIRKEVLAANEKWNKLEDVEKKSASKITFAVDEDLVTVFHVEMFDRKGEWEIHATERLRFKRRIDDVEKVLSPCLHPMYRLNIFKKLIEPDL